MKYDDLRALLKSNGASLTKPRKMVFDLLLNQDPQTIQQLLKRADGQVDRATVYRTVELFESVGVVNRLNIGWKYKLELSDIFSGHHHHFHCTSCNKTYELAGNSMLETMIDSIAAREGYAPRGHQLEISGLCSNCQGL